MAEPIAAFEKPCVFFNMDVGKKFVIIWKKAATSRKFNDSFM